MSQTLETLITPRPLEDWCEEHGDVLWWKFPICEPPYVGSPLDTAWEEDQYDYTHWTPIPIVYDAQGNVRCQASPTGEHRWGIDGQHNNEYCKLCFINKPQNAE